VDTGAKSTGCEISVEFAIRTLGLDEKRTRELVLSVHGEKFPYRKVIAEIERLAGESLEKGPVALRPGFDKFMDALDAAGISYAIATSADKKTALLKLEKAGVRERFLHFVFGDEIANGKPAPDIFLKAAKKLGTALEGCLGFEDSSAGLQSLSAAGIRSVFIKDLADPDPETLKTVWRQYPSLAEAAEIFSPSPPA
jgi:HAD superfamily hydrolase (TIGR01509 family)